MPTYKMKAPDGNEYQIDGPAGATDDQVREQILKQHPNAGTAPSKSLLEKGDSAVEAFIDQFRSHGRDLLKTASEAVRESVNAGPLGLFLNPITGQGGEGDYPLADALKGTIEGTAKQAFERPVSETAGKVVKAAGGAVQDITKKLTDPSGRGVGELAESATELLVPGKKALESVGAGIKAVREFGTTAESRAAAQLEKIKPEAIKIHEGATADAGLPQSDTYATPKGGDLESTIRNTGETRYNALWRIRKNISDKTWQRFRDTGEALEQQGAHFTLTQEGADFIGDLEEIESGGGPTEGTKYSDKFRSMAKDLRERLSGVNKEDYRRKPVTMNVVDEELRRLREIQADAGREGFGAIERQRARELGDRLESALESWVGKDNYPRKQYKELSKELNKFGTKLGQAIVGRQDVDFLGPDVAPGEYQGKLARKLFADSRSISEGKELLGEEAFNKLAERYASNVFRTKSAPQVLEWLGQNNWVKDVPGLQEKALKYAQVQFERAGDAEGLRKVIEARKAMLKKVATATVGGAAAGAGAYGAYELLGRRQ